MRRHDTVPHEAQRMRAQWAMARWRASRRAVHRGQRGQALIEFAMFFVFLMFLLTGVTDIGGLLDVHIAVVYAARQGARTGSVMGPVSSADCEIVGAIHSALLNQPNFTLTRIVIYKATGTTNGRFSGTQPAEIYPGHVTCTGGAIVDSTSGVAVSPTTDTWNATTRSITPFSEDSLGVELDYTYQFQFNLLGTTFTAVDYSVCPMNPSGAPTPATTAT